MRLASNGNLIFHEETTISGNTLSLFYKATTFVNYMFEYLYTIQQLKALDLSLASVEQIRALIGQFGKFGIINMTLHKGKAITRVRENKPGEHFNTRSALSYVPAQYNTSFQRASTPDQTMFYGSVVPENLDREELKTARFAALLEGSPFMRRPNQVDGEILVTFSKWIVTDDIPLIALVYHKDFVTQSPHTQELYNSYQAGSASWSPIHRAQNAAITGFLAAEFAKSNIDAHTDYKISALLTQIALSKGMAGVYYPSVRADAKGYNVAISPTYADNCLRLVAAGECTVYRRRGHTIVDNETICEVADDSQAFTLERIATEHHIGRENVLRELQ
jgi:hypothetical protein